MDKLRELKKRVRDYSNFKKEKKAYQQDMENFYKEREKQLEEQQFQDFKDRVYGAEVEVKTGGLIKGKPKLAMKGWK